MRNRMPSVAKQRWFSWCAMTVWLGGSVGGYGLLLQYKATPGPLTQVPRHWPWQATLARSEFSPSLLMFAHPRCPCTRASLNELAQVLSSCRDTDLTARVIFHVPKSLPTDWTESHLVAQARDIHGVEVIWDPNGDLTKRFGVQTSGHVLLYDQEGMLTFSGGITGLRGHEGENAGRETVISFVRSRPRNASPIPVFGCPLIGHQAAVCRSPSRNVP